MASETGAEKMVRIERELDLEDVLRDAARTTREREFVGTTAAKESMESPTWEDINRMDRGLFR